MSDDEINDIVVVPQNNATPQNQGSGNNANVTPSVTPNPAPQEVGQNDDNGEADFGLAKGKTNLNPTPQVTTTPNPAPGANATTTTTETPKDKSMELLDDTYGGTLKEYGEVIKKLEEERKIAQKEDEKRTRREANMQMISSIVDGLGGLANLIGVTQGASNINLASATGALDPKFEAARQQRRADIKDINTRLDQKIKELNAVKEKYGTTKANLQRSLDSEEKEYDYKNKNLALQWEELRRGDEYKKLSLGETIRHNTALEANAKAQLDLQTSRLRSELRKDNVGLVSGDSLVSIPRENVNEQTIGQIYNLVEDDVKERFFGSTTNKDVTQGADGSIKIRPTSKVQTSTGAPTLEQMLAIVGMASQGDSQNAATIREAISQLANKSKGKSSSSIGW